MGVTIPGADVPDRLRWRVDVAGGFQLRQELRTIEDELAALPPTGFTEGSWQREVATMVGVVPESLVDCFIDVDGESLFERLRNLAEIAVARGCPISFQ